MELWVLERVFEMISPQQFERSFSVWMKEVLGKNEGDIVSIDGKTMRGTGSASQDKKTIHVVSAFSKQNGLVLRQTRTEEKSNKITAVPELLKLMMIKGCIVIVDALNTQ